MSSLIEVRKKIQSVSNTRKITQAMELVAASRMKSFQRKAMSIRSYAHGLLELLLQNDQSIRELSYSEKRTEGATLFVLITSDKGLCGAMNTRLVRELFQSEAWNALAEKDRLLITVGRKSHDAARKFNAPVLRAYQGVKEDLDQLDALESVDTILGYWERKECREVRLIAPEYVNPFVFHTQMKTYLPLGTAMLLEHNLLETEPEPIPEPVQEPSSERVAESLSEQLVQMLFTQAFFELKATEYSSRMVAMKNATEAAKELGRSLALTYNKARQAKITQELAEISGAVAAME